MRYFLFFVFLLLLASCSTNSNFQNSLSRDNELLPSDSSIVTAWPKTDGLQKGEYYQEFDSLKYIYLETTERSMLDQIQDIYVLEDRFLVVSSTLKMFDFLGKYLCDVGQKGNAANEYGAIGDVFVTANNEIYVSDLMRNRLLKYSARGEYLHTYSGISSIPSKFCILSDSLIVGSEAGRSSYVSYFQMKCLSANGKLLYEAFPNETGVSAVAAQLIPNDSLSCYIHCPFSDYIYLVDNSSITPIISMGYYDDETLIPFIQQSRGKDVQAFNSLAFSQSKVVSALYLIKCQNSWFAMYQLGKKSILSFIGSERRDYLRSDFEVREVHYPETFVSSLGDWLIGYIDPIAFDYLNEEKIASTIARINTFADEEMSVDVLRDQNPIVVMYHLKNK